MIKKREFKAGNFKKKRNQDRNTHPISLFLKKNTSNAYKSNEIAKKIKMNENTVRSMIGKLVEGGFVVHKSPYFAWK